MAGWQIDREPTLDELLHDDVIVQAVRSAGFETEAFRAHLADIARRVTRPAEALRQTARLAAA